MALPAVRAACHRALTARDQRIKEYPQWEEWRHQARKIKAEAICRLEELLSRLAREVQAWGGQVLWAKDAAQARELILGLARKHRVTTVVKAKSMTTEEIGLNPALAAAGLRSWETDLGEFLVQLAGQPPAHLTAPALHLDRHQIAALLAERLGGDCPPEPEALTRKATEYIRPHFWEAGLGLTGVNFAAPDGTLVFLENEGNLGLTATVPRVQVAVMGLEKLIPSLEDLEVLLRLLPASATGQRLTALVHFLRGCKFQPEGRQAFYLIILDNGRRSLAQEPELREALYCLRCGACLNICPVFQLRAAYLYGRVYPGAIGILLAPHLNPVGDLSDLCTQCGACQEICPVGINLAEKILEVRGRSPRFRGLRLASGLAGQILVRPRLYRGLEPALRLLQAAGAKQGRRLAGLPLAPESFFRARQAQRTEDRLPGDLAALDFSSRHDEAGAPGAEAAVTGPGANLETRLQEAGAILHRVQGPAELARWLAPWGEPLWLQDHLWLRAAAPELTALGRSPHFPATEWGPAGKTAVIVGLGAIPETGSVLIEAASGPAAALAFRVRRLVVIVPADQADLSLAQALKLTARQTPMVTWLTGPSRTADIEKVLVLGAQGPQELHLVLYQAEE